MWDWVGGRTSRALRGRPPARGAAGPRRRRRCSPAPPRGRGDARPGRREEPGGAARARVAPRDGRPRRRRTWSSSPTRTGSSSSRATSSSSSWSRSARRRTSTGNVVHQGIAVYGNKGSTDQHAYVQQLREGVTNFFVTFIEVAARPRPARVARGRARRHLGRLPPRLPPRHAQGALRERARLDHAHRSRTSPRAPSACSSRSTSARSASTRTLVDVNAYHQPGVEAGQEGRRRGPRAAGAGSSRTCAREKGALPDRREDRGVARRAGRDRDRLQGPRAPRGESRPRRRAKGRADVLPRDVRRIEMTGGRGPARFLRRRSLRA